VTGALAGLRVLDLSRLLPGGFCSLLLADMGADVVKVEDTGAGDYLRWAEPRHEGADPTAGGAMFLALNRGKRSVRIDLKAAQGVEVLLRLARDADVLLESFRSSARSPATGRTGRSPRAPGTTSTTSHAPGCSGSPALPTGRRYRPQARSPTSAAARCWRRSASWLRCASATAAGRGRSSTCR
jgi:hypothetical protein